MKARLMPGLGPIRVDALTSARPSAPESTYVWRDPARIARQRLAELEAEDRRATGHGEFATLTRAEYRAALIAQFTAHRAAGVGVAEAARLAGVGERTGHRYEAIRKAQQ